MPHIEIYTQPFCPYCARAKALLDSKGVTFDEYDTFAEPRRRTEMLTRVPGHKTVPQIFIDGRHIGGSDELTALDQAGELDPLLQPTAS